VKVNRVRILPWAEARKSETESTVAGAVAGVIPMQLVQ